MVCFGSRAHAEDRRHVFFPKNCTRSCAQTRRRDPDRRVARWGRIRGLGLYRNPMNSTYWIGVDVGTGGSRAILLDAEGREAAAVSVAHEEMTMEQPLWAEQRPENWADAAFQAIRGALAAAGITGDQVRGMGLSGQMHGLVILDGDHQVIRPALIWCDQRSQPQVDWINQHLGATKVLEHTANPVLTGFTLPKLLWLRDHEPHNFERVRHVLLPKDYLRYRLTGELATEVSDASGTAMFDVVH